MNTDSNDSPSLRSRVWNLLRTARDTGRTAVPVTTLAVALTVTPEAVLGAVMPDMTETPAGADAPPVYCQPTGNGPVLAPRTYEVDA